MGMMQQLFQTKSAGGGQQEEKSGSSGIVDGHDAAAVPDQGQQAEASRGDANDNSGGTGRAPCEEGAASTRVVAMTATAAGGKMSSRSRRASDGSRPTDETGWRSEVSAGVGLMINMQRGKATDSFLAGAAHDGDRVLNSDFQRQFPVVTPVMKGGFQKIKHEFFLRANMLDISAHFVGQGTRVIPVEGPLKQRGQCAFTGRVCN